MDLTINTKSARPSEIIHSQQEIIRQQQEIIDVLKGALAASGEATILAQAEWMRPLTAQERALVGALYASYPRVSSRVDLLEKLPGHDHVRERQLQLVTIIVHKIRKKLGAEVIITERGCGVRLGQGFYETVSKNAT